MRYFYLLLFFFTSSTLLRAQQITIVDNKTKDPIPAANIYFYKDSKNVLAASTNNLGQVTYNQDYDYFVVSFVGYKDKKYKKHRDETITIYLEEDVKKLKEIVVKADNRKIELGDYTSRSSHSRVIGLGNTYGRLFFPPDTTKTYKIYSIFLNLKKVPQKSTIRFSFYQTTNHQFTGNSQNGKTTYTSSEIIPDTDNKVGFFDYTLNPNDNKQIEEIKIDSTVITIPQRGIFVTLETIALYDENNTEQPLKPRAEYPILYFHTTREANICELWIHSTPNEWHNSSKREMEYNKANGDNFIFSDFYEPSIGLKIMENREIQEETK